MSEYDAKYDWNKTWLNADPTRRYSSPEKPSEKLLGEKRHYLSHDTFSLCDHFSKPSSGAEDPYFLLGQGSEKFGRTVRYRNRRFRAKSAPRARQLTPPPKVERAKDDLAINITTKKSKSKKHKEHKKRPVERWPDIKLDLTEASLDRPSTGAVRQTNTDPQIPKDRPKTAPLKSEYQRSYSPPPAYIYKKPRKKKYVATVITPQQEQRAKTQEYNKPEEIKSSHVKSTPRFERYAPYRPAQYRPETYVPHTEHGKHHFTSEYQANYRNFSDLINEDERREQSAIVRGKMFAVRNKDSNFSREYFAQLKGSAGAKLWDSQTTNRSNTFGLDKCSMERCMKNYNLPPAGQPTYLLDNEEANSIGRHILRASQSNAPTFSRAYEPSLYSGHPSIKFPLRRTFSCSRSPQRDRPLRQLSSSQSPIRRISPKMHSYTKFTQNKSPHFILSTRSPPRFSSPSPLSKLPMSSASLNQSSPCPHSDNKTFILSSPRRREDFLMQSHTNRLDFAGKLDASNELSCQVGTCIF